MEIQIKIGDEWKEIKGLWKCIGLGYFKNLITKKIRHCTSSEIRNSKWIKLWKN